MASGRNALGLWNAKQKDWDVSDTGITVSGRLALRRELSFLWQSWHNNKGEARKRWPLAPVRALRRLWQQPEKGLFVQLRSEEQAFSAKAVCVTEQRTGAMLQSNEDLPHLMSLEQKDRSQTPHLTFLLGNQPHVRSLTVAFHSCWFCTDGNLL